jgi:hypothetical protein
LYKVEIKDHFKFIFCIVWFTWLFIFYKNNIKFHIDYSEHRLEYACQKIINSHHTELKTKIENEFNELKTKLKDDFGFSRAYLDVQEGELHKHLNYLEEKLFNEINNNFLNENRSREVSEKTRKHFSENPGYREDPLYKE